MLSTLFITALAVASFPLYDWLPASRKVTQTRILNSSSVYFITSLAFWTVLTILSTLVTFFTAFLSFFLFETTSSSSASPRGDSSSSTSIPSSSVASTSTSLSSDKFSVSPILSSLALVSIAEPVVTVSSAFTTDVVLLSAIPAKSMQANASILVLIVFPPSLS